MDKDLPIVYNKNGLRVSKPFIFSETGSIEFYANPNTISIIETAPADDRKKSFYFNMTRDEYSNYELHLRVNPDKIIYTVQNILSIGEDIRDFFSKKR